MPAAEDTILGPAVDDNDSEPAPAASDAGEAVQAAPGSPSAAPDAIPDASATVVAPPVVDDPFDYEVQSGPLPEDLKARDKAISTIPRKHRISTFSRREIVRKVKKKEGVVVKRASYSKTADASSSRPLLLLLTTASEML